MASASGFRGLGVGSLGVMLALHGCGGNGNTGTESTSSSGSTGGAGPSSSASGSASSGAGGGDGGSLCQGNPITAAEDQWSWVPFPDTQCAFGTPAGIGINPTSKSDKLLIYLMGGGACFTQAECVPGCNMQFQHCAANLDGYDQNKLAQETSLFQQGSIFDRNASGNPFKEYSFVFVPYCTGDFHSGGQKSNYGIYHVGYNNMTAYLARVAPTFCKAGRVVLAGSSAGGFGAVFNYHQVKAAFGAMRVDLIDDSGPPLGAAYMPLQDTMRAAWGSAANAPPGCAACKTGWDAFFPYLSAQHPGARMSLVSSLQDPSIGPYFGGPIASPQGYHAALNDFADKVINPLPNARIYYVDEFHHVYLGQPLTAKVSLGVSLSTFLTQQIADDPAWMSVRP